MDLTHTQKLAQEWRIVQTHIYCPRKLIPHDVGHETSNSPSRDVGGKQSIGNSPNPKHLGHTTARWAIFIGYISRQLFIWEIICWAFTMGSDTILVMDLTHTQKLAQE